MRVDPTPTISTRSLRGRARRARCPCCQAAPASPRYTSPPNVMFLPNTPPAGENTLPASAVPAAVSPPDNMFQPNTSPAGENILAASGSLAAMCLSQSSLFRTSLTPRWNLSGYSRLKATR